VNPEPPQPIPQLLAIFRRALQFFELAPLPRRTLEATLHYSYGLGEFVARFQSHKILLLETALPYNRLSEALRFLECSRLLQRQGRGKGGLILTPLPDWWHWALTPISPVFADREFLATLIGWRVYQCGDHWQIHPLRKLHPDLLYASAFAQGKFDEAHFWPPEATLAAEVAAVARAEALSAADTSAGAEQNPPLSSISGSLQSICPSSVSGDGAEGGNFVPSKRNNPAAASDADIEAMGWKLFGDRWDARLQGLVTSYALNSSRKAVAITLARGLDQTTPINVPHRWFKAVFQDVCRQCRITPKPRKEIPA